MTTWIESKHATLLKLKHPLELLEEYQKYLVNDPFCFPDWDEDDVEHGPMDFELWLEHWEDQMDWEQSDMFQNEMFRLSEKD